MLLECIHPNCHSPLTRQNSLLCGPHYGHLTKSLKEQMKFAVIQGGGVLDDFKVDLAEYFRDRDIGDLEVAVCRFCDEDIVWFVNRNGKPYCVDANGVEPGDEKYVEGRHSFHNCRRRA